MDEQLAGFKYFYAEIVQVRGPRIHEYIDEVDEPCDDVDHVVGQSAQVLLNRDSNWNYYHRVKGNHNDENLPGAPLAAMLHD